MVRALCFGAALLFAVDRGAAQTVEPTDPSSVCVRLLRDSRVPQGRAVGFFEAGLAEVAPDSVPTLVRILVERSVPGLDDGEQPQTLSGPQLELIMQALAGADPAVLLAEIPALVVQEESTPEQRAAAVRLVALAGDSDQLVQVLNLTANPDEVRYGSALHAALDWSLLRCLQQAPNQTQRALKAPGSGSSSITRPWPAPGRSPRPGHRLASRCCSRSPDASQEYGLKCSPTHAASGPAGVQTSIRSGLSF